MALRTFAQLLLLLNEIHILYGQTGPFGQDCTPAQGDYPDKCPTVGGTYVARRKIECIHNFDCCTCGRIICNKCDGFIANGDSSAFGAKDIVINGDKNDGSIIDCNGDLSCKETGIFGQNIKEIKFTGDAAAAYSEVDVSCIACPVYCVGDNACEYANMRVENSYGISFSARAGQYGTFNLINNLGGHLGCTSYDACKSAQITINNIDRISCDGENSCQDAVINVLNPKNREFVVECKSSNSCKNLRLNIEVDDPKITSLAGISCNGRVSCQGLTVTVYKKRRQKQLEIQYLNCNAYKACDNVKFTLTNTRFRSCQCPTDVKEQVMG